MTDPMNHCDHSGVSWPKSKDELLREAGPEMLEALKLAQTALERAGITIGDVGHAIAKAEGRD